MAKSKKEATETPVAEKKVADIIRGRIPVALVAVIRFGMTDKKDAEIATIFRTTGGKVADIRHNRNFAYVTDAFKPTQAQIQDAAAWIAECKEEHRELLGARLAELGQATDEEAAAFESQRKDTRKPRESTGAKKEAEPAKAPEAEVSEADEESVDAALDDL